jgi:hypothetical protein
LRNAIRRKAVVFCVVTTVILGGNLLLTALSAPLYVIVGYLIAAFAVLTYVFGWYRMRRRDWYVVAIATATMFAAALLFTAFFWLVLAGLWVLLMVLTRGPLRGQWNRWRSG